MRRSIKSAIALLAVSALPLISVAPAAATSPTLSTFNFDCEIHSENEWEVPLYGDEITITFTNCDADGYILDSQDTGHASTTEGDVEDVVEISIDTVTVTDDVALQIHDGEGNYFADIYVAKPYSMPNPAGSLLADTEQTLGLQAPETTFGTAQEVDDESEILVDNVDSCTIIAGDHVYAAQPFTVEKNGEYTFRMTGLEPVSSLFDSLGSAASGEYHPLSDTMMALYRNFDPNESGAGIVGCNDDLRQLALDGHDYDENHFNITESGDFIEGHMPYFGVELEPGTYTMVFTTWEAISADEWAAGEANQLDVDYFEYEWEPTDSTIHFEVWGPEDGITLGLADTGVEPALALWSGLALAGTGVAITVARRRANRA